MSVEANKKLIEKVNDAFRTGDMENVLSYYTDDVRWSMAGMPVWDGKQAVRDSMKGNDEYPEPPEFTVEHMIAENDMVVCTGISIMTKKTGEKTKSTYCDMYKVENGKVKEMTTWFAELK
jgi:uncharacterized protein (TIGR02246 family)